MPSPTEVANFQRLLITLSAQGALAVTNLWNQYQNADPETRWEALQEAFPEVIDPFLAAAVVLSTEWYRSLDPESTFPVQPVPTISKNALAANATWALTQANPLPNLVGSVERQVFNASRGTIISNVEVEGVKYARYASANACSFCRILSTRGGVFVSERSATRVVGRGRDLSMMERRMRAAGTPLPFRPRFDERGAEIDPDAVSLGGYKRRGSKSRGRFIAGGSGQLRGSQKLGDKFHDNCHCVAVPVRFGQSYEPPDFAAGWEQDYFNAKDAAAEAGKTKGEYGAIDIDAVINEMRKARYPAEKDLLNAERRARYAAKKAAQNVTPTPSG